MKNLKAFFLLALICLFAFAAIAQSSAGFKAGVNYAGINGYHGDHRIHFHAGFFARIPLHAKWHLQPELVYSGEGQQYRLADGEEHAGTKASMALNYATFPLMVQFAVQPRIYLEAGPQLSVLLSAFSKGIGSDELNIKRSFSSTAFGVNVGAGFQVTSCIGIHARYHAGMSDIIPDNSSRNTSGVAQLGISFRLCKSKAKLQ